MAGNGGKRLDELASFLRVHRAALRPEQVGLPAGTRRRTPGLRREEVAQLVGVSTTWYTWLEQGRDVRASAELLDNLAHVLRLDADERAHLFTLARRPLPDQPIDPAASVSPAIRQLFAALAPYPAHVRTTRWDVLAWNRAEALIAPWASIPEERRNAVWHHFTDPTLRVRFVDWEAASHNLLALFRMENGHRLGTPHLAEFVRRLEEAGPEFAAWWPQQQVQRYREEPIALTFPAVGQLQLQRVILQVGLNSARTLRALVPLPGTDAEAKLRTLWETV